MHPIIFFKMPLSLYRQNASYNPPFQGSFCLNMALPTGADPPSPPQKNL